MKKGLAVQFKWIFSVVAGAIILIFFIRFAFLQTGMNQNLENREILASLSDQLEAFSIASKSSKEIDIGKEVDIKFSCENLSIEEYSKNMNKIIFARDLSGSKLKAVTLSWKYPFKAGNFFYLSDDKTKYYFLTSINDNRYKSFPDIFDKVAITNLGMINDKDSVVVVFSNPGSIGELSRVIYIDEANNRVMFYKEEKDSFYFGDELMYGAILTADYEEYKCLLGKAVDRLKNIAYIYRDKASKLQVKAKSNECRTLYSSIYSYINGFNFNDMTRLKEFNSKLDEQNRELNRNDCATLF